MTHQTGGEDFYDDDPPIPDGHVLCPRCDGHQEVPCYCGGDFCICENYGDKPCPLCGGAYGGEGYVSEERAEQYLRKQAEFHAVIRPLFKNGGEA